MISYLIFLPLIFLNSAGTKAFVILISSHSDEETGCLFYSHNVPCVIDGVSTTSPFSFPASQVCEVHIYYTPH